MMLGRTIRLAGAEKVAGVEARWYTRGFVTADVTTLVVQGLGESLFSLFFDFPGRYMDGRSLVGE